MKEVVELLTKQKKTIATMESCTGGGLVNEITNIEGASEVLKYSAVTYSNSFKVKMGVDSKVIDIYTVYSMEVADEMSRAISLFAESNYGVGITGKLNRVDKRNLTGEDNKVYISIYDRDKDKFYHKEVWVDKKTRASNKSLVIENVIELLKTILQ